MEQKNDLENIEQSTYKKVYDNFFQECTVDIMNESWVITKQEVKVSSSKKINRKTISTKFVKTERERLIDLIENSYYMVSDQRTTNYVIKIQVEKYKDEADPNILYNENGITYKKTDLLLDKEFRKDIIKFYRKVSSKIFVKFFTVEGKKVWLIMLCWN